MGVLCVWDGKVRRQVCKLFKSQKCSTDVNIKIFVEAKDDGDDGDNWTIGAISRAKLQSNHYHQQTNIQFLLYRPDALPVAQPTMSKH